MVITHGRWNKREQRYPVIKRLNGKHPILLTFTPHRREEAVTTCTHCGKQQLIIYTYDNEAQRGNYLVIPSK